MESNQFKSLRTMIVITLSLLTIQYELGMAISLSPNLPELASFGFSLTKISDALHHHPACASRSRTWPWYDRLRPLV